LDGQAEFRPQQQSGASESFRADLAIERSRDPNRYTVRPLHERAANWLGSMGDYVPLHDGNLQDFIDAAVRAGFEVALQLDADEHAA
jgi:hypothetical protein